MRRAGRGMGIVLAGALAGLTATAQAATPEATSNCQARLHFIDAHLSHTAHRARAWSWWWGVGLGVATVANLAVVPFVDAEDRIDYYIGAATSFVGLVPLVVMPLTVMSDGRDLREKITTGAACPELLPEAEAMLIRDAANQAEGRAWWMHAANVVVNGGAGLYLGLARDHWASGIVTAVVGTAIGEAMIITQPVDSIADLDLYRRDGARMAIVPVLAPGHLGLRLAARF